MSLSVWFQALSNKLNRLRWRLGMAICGVLFMAMLIFSVAVNLQINDLINQFFASLEPQLGQIMLGKLESFADQYQSLVGSRALVIATFAGVFLIGVVVAGFTAKHIAKPLEQIALAAADVARGNLKARVLLTPSQQASNDELLQLAMNFNTMTASLEHLENERIATNAAIAHELRTPLMVLQARLECVRDGVIPMVPSEADLLLGQVQTLARLVDDLRTLSLADADRLDFKLEQIDLLDVLSLCIASFSVRTDAKNIALNLNCTALAAPVYGDRDRLSQVVTNLLENALRHTPNSGSISVDLTLDTHSVLVKVTDTGSGFPSEALPQVFERFYRADPSRSRASGGSGLGLSLVKVIIERHGGTVVATNVVDGGAQLQFQLPSAITD
jgi:two-component system, OmpR family, sensor histidine kinase BaeS